MTRIGFLLVLSIVCMPHSAFADMRAKKRMSMGGQAGAPAFESTVLVKGARERQEMQLMPGMSTINIQQCDLKRMVVLNERNKTYMITPMDDTDETAAAAPSQPQPKPDKKSSAPSSPGGVITITSNIVDTGETRQMFGYKARRIKTEMTSDASPGSQCAVNMNMKTDGWYIDFTEQQAICAANPRAMTMARGDGSGCKDKVRFRSRGNAKLGYPVSMEITMAGPQGQPLTMKHETLELSKAQLDQSLFEIPPGYREVKSYQELMGGFTGMVGAAMSGAQQMASNMASGPVGEASSGVPAKGAGQIRIGVVRLGNSAGAAVPDTRFRDQLVSELRVLNFDTQALALNNNAPKDEIFNACKQLDCDYVLFTDVTQAKDSSSGKKVGGFFAKATGLDSAATAATYQLGLKFKLFGIDDANTPKLDAAANAAEANLDASGAAVVEREAMMTAVQIKKEQEIKRRMAKRR